MIATYWEVGRRIVEFEQGGKQRAEYGEELIERRSRDLTERHGRGFSRQNVWSMRQFFLAFPSQKILQTASGEFTDAAISILQTSSGELSPAPISATLSPSPPDDTLSLLRTLAARFPLPWSHYVKLLTVKDENARRFYEDEALRSGWSVRQLDRQIGSLFYERTLLSRDKALPRQGPGGTMAGRGNRRDGARPGESEGTARKRRPQGGPRPAALGAHHRLPVVDRQAARDTKRRECQPANPPRQIAEEQAKAAR